MEVRWSRVAQRGTWALAGGGGGLPAHGQVGGRPSFPVPVAISPSQGEREIQIDPEGYSYRI